MNAYKYKIIAEFEEEKYKKTEDYVITYPYGEKGFEVNDIESNIIFTTKQKAIDNAKKRIQNDEIFNAHLLVIESLGVDDNIFETQFTVMNLHNNKEYESSFSNEYNHNDVLYEKGNWIYFYANQRFQIGLISEKAKGQEPFLVTTENNCLSDGHTHEHVEKMWIIKKLDYKEVQKILPYKFLSNIELRFSFYNIKNK